MAYLSLLVALQGASRTLEKKAHHFNRLSKLRVTEAYSEQSFHCRRQNQAMGSALVLWGMHLCYSGAAPLLRDMHLCYSGAEPCFSLSPSFPAKSANHFAAMHFKSGIHKH